LIAASHPDGKFTQFDLIRFVIDKVDATGHFGIGTRTELGSGSAEAGAEGRQESAATRANNRAVFVVRCDRSDQ
jgi:hypothetical protein